MKRIAPVAALAVSLLGFATPAFASANPSANDFGQHHSQMARNMGGFSGEMNPGMHQGKSNWDSCDCQ